MRNEMNDVRAFHEKFDVPVGVPLDESLVMSRRLLEAMIMRIDDFRCDGSLGSQRLSYILEEFMELDDAMHHSDRLKVFDAMLDIMYFVYGTAVMFGFTTNQMEAGWDEIQRVNMTKIRVPGMDKIQKPANYTPPNLQRCLNEA